MAEDQSSGNTVERVCDGPLAVVVRVGTVYTQSEKRPESAPSAVYDWIYFKDSPLVLVTAEIRQAAPFAWDVSIKNEAENWALANVRFPQVAIREFSDDMRLLVPHCCGEIERNPCRRAYRFDSLYPNGWCTMEFEAVYSPSKRTGLYWAMHDPRGSAKRIRASGDPAAASVTLGFEHPVPNMRKRGIGYELSGTARWQLLRRDEGRKGRAADGNVPQPGEGRQQSRPGRNVPVNPSLARQGGRDHRPVVQ